MCSADFINMFDEGNGRRRICTRSGGSESEVVDSSGKPKHKLDGNLPVDRCRRCMSV